MTATTPSTALATIQPALTESERLTLAGFLAGYRGLTREAYTLDLAAAGLSRHVARPGVKCPQPGLLATTGQGSLCSCAKKSSRSRPGCGTAIG
jgi:hypothetical protein